MRPLIEQKTGKAAYNTLTITTLPACIARQLPQMHI